MALPSLPAWGLLLAALQGCTGQVVHCPKPGEEFKKSSNKPKMRGAKATFQFTNHADMDVSLWWVDFDGNEVYRGVTGAGDTISGMGTFPGHIFNVRALVDNALLMSYMAGSNNSPLVVGSCGHDDASKLVDKSRWPEFEKLAAGANDPCEGSSESSSHEWSCVRWVSPDAHAKRAPSEYGFHKDDAPYGRKAGQQIDWSYGTSAQDRMLNVTDFDGGYLKMKMTDKMKEVLYPWYQDRLKDALEPHGNIAGGYTNSHVVPMDKIDLDKFPEVHIGIIREMSQVLQWWTRKKLRHTSTFGLRVYRRGSMLVNHIDRQDTHIASAVLQVGQQIDEDGGWPLEVVHPHFPGVKEVYLQHGEMVLYEGARIHHGRPMRLKGEEFG